MILCLLVAGMLGVLIASSPAAAAEPDDNIPGVVATSPVSGTVNDVDPDDVIAVTVPARSILKADLTGNEASGLQLFLFGPSANDVNTSPWLNDVSGSPHHLSYFAEAAGTYYLDVYWAQAGGSYTLTYSIETPGDVTGTVTNAAGDKLAGIEVTGYQSDGSGGWTVAGSATTLGDGSYDLALPSGTFRVGFADPTRQYGAEYYDDKASVDTAADVTVVAGATTAHIDAQLATTGRISGRVTNAAGWGLSGIYVVVYDAGATDPNDIAAWAVTKGSGNYSVAGLSSGEYRVWFFDQYASNYLSEYYKDKASVAEAELVKVTGGEATAGIDAVLRDIEDKTLSAFTFAGLSPAVSGIIDETTHAVAVTVPYGTDVTKLTPTVTINGESLSPASGTPQDFSSPVTYTVTAYDGTVQDYVVTVTVAPPPTKLTLTLSGVRVGVLKLGKTVAVKGKVAPIHAVKATVTIQRRGSSSWVTAKTLTCAVNATSGAYSSLYKPVKRGKYRIRVAVPRVGDYSAALSVWRSFTVK